MANTIVAMANTLIDLFYSLGSCLACFPSTPTLKMNGRSFKMIGLLGEGGFSYVYLVQDSASAALYALKKIRCPFGAESVAQAMREVEAYRLFAHADGIIHSVDYSVETDGGGGGGTSIGDAGAGGGPGKTVYILLPYYRRGSLQDLINANLVKRTHFPERDLLRLFLGVCKALRGMHQYHAAPAGAPSTAGERMEMPGSSMGGADATAPATGGGRRSATTAGADDTFEAEQQRPLMAGESMDGRGGGGGNVKSYAHRDIKPENIMIADDGVTPVLMDLGSVAASPVAITSRSLAIATQDEAAEHSTLPYRAPELLDVKTGAVVDTKTDIWSLGCTLYAGLVGISPFEKRSDETGGVLAICILGGDWRFPDERKTPRRPLNAQQAHNSANGIQPYEPPAVSEPVRKIVHRCLCIEPAERPDIDELIKLVEDVLVQLDEEA